MIFKPNDSLDKAKKAKEKISKKYGKNEWYVSSDVKHDKEFGYFLNVCADKSFFDAAKEVLPLTSIDTFIFVEAMER